MRGIAREERGVALVTVLLFMVLTFIMIATMLASTGNELVISGFHRDSVRALDVAQAGVQEAERRIEADRPLNGAGGFTGSIQPLTNVKVIYSGTLGVNAAYKEVQSTATVGRATRRVSALVLQRGTLMVPNVLAGHAITEPGSPSLILSGDVYARTFIRYQDVPNSGGYTYAGWRLSAVPHSCTSPCGVDGILGPCYTHPQCVTLNQPGWYPAVRRTEYETTPVAQDIKAWAATHCVAGSPVNDPTTIQGRVTSDPSPEACISPACTGTVQLYGWDRDEYNSYGQLITQGPRAVTAKLPCGLPYKLVEETFAIEDGTMYKRLYKTVVFEQWFDNYWQFDESQLTYVKKPDLLTWPEFGATTPIVATAPGNFDTHLVGGQNLNTDLGCKAPEMSCAGGNSRPMVIWLEQCGGCQDWNITSPMKGHGVLFVNGNLQINGDFEYWGTIVVTGMLILSSPSAILHGGVIAQQTVQIDGTIRIYGGTSVGSPPVGRSTVTPKSWWER